MLKMNSFSRRLPSGFAIAAVLMMTALPAQAVMLPENTQAFDAPLDKAGIPSDVQVLRADYQDRRFIVGSEVPKVKAKFDPMDFADQARDNQKRRVLKQD